MKENLIKHQPHGIKNTYKISHKLFSDWRMSEAMCSLFALVGTLICTIDYELTYSTRRTSDNCDINIFSADSMKLMILITTIISVMYLVLALYHKKHWEMYMNHIYSQRPLPYINFRDVVCNMKWYKWLEVLVLLIIPYPEADFRIYMPLRYHFKVQMICYNYSEISYIVMMLRIVIVLRAISLFSPYENHLARNYCRKYKIPTDFRFGMKCLIAQYPLYVITISSVTSMIVLAAIFRVLERPMDSMTTFYYSDYLNALWFLFENMSTLGYGEYLPVTDLGRVVTVVGFFAGTSLFSLMILTLTNKLNLNDNQTKAFTKIYKTNAAANAIKAAIKYYLHKVKFGKYSHQAKQSSEILRKKCKALKANKVKIEEITKRNTEAIVDVKISVALIQNKMKRVDKTLDSMINQLQLI